MNQQNYKNTKEINKNTNKKINKNTNKKTKVTLKPIYNLYHCPCGGGQSCIVNRREVGDWVHEDDIFRKANIPIRKNCYTTHSQNQLNAMRPYFPN